ncbi:hypothetical protein K7640_19720 [Micromonospora sp. PLK6-60]|uniref:hypothetical protein n=1 Tax=Micromonospora sp. PLK6-60 TaxID=2873383 RepID=UPI001CA7050E|nr:hypothetical protein [Micromonospora sp. PLK6-60]MBY8874058.1 hypothetical protein [Micromonospora sp. PLK6-60]
MVHRYESAEDDYGDPRQDVELPGPRLGPPPSAGPSPSRFPTPALPRTTRLALPPSEPTYAPTDRGPYPPPAPAYAPTDRGGSYPPPPDRPAPVRSAGYPPQPAPQAYQPTVPPQQPPGRHTGQGGGRLWPALAGGAAVLVLLALFGLGGAALLADRTGDPGAGQTDPPAALPSTQAADSGRQDLDSRDTDQAPLTAKEVFPGQKLIVADGRPAYRVLKTQAGGDCKVAATGEVADLLVRLGCNQVVRATLRSPDGDHLLTAGLFNLTDVASAQRARDRVRQLLDERQGRFRGMAAGEDTEAVARAAARVGWQVRGHYLAYCLVTRADGEAVKAGDPAAREILFDMIELYLNQGVLERRAAGGVASQPTAGSSTATQRGTDPDELPGD